MKMCRAVLWSSITLLLGSLPVWAEIPGSLTARQALVLPITAVNVDSGTLSRTIDYFRDVSGANIVVDWKILEAAGISKDAPITLQVKNLSLKKMLQLTLDQASPSVQLVFSVDQNVIEITTQEDADSKMVLRVYDVNELVMPFVDDTPPPTISVNTAFAQGSASGGGGGASVFGSQTTAQSTTDTKETRGEHLATVIRTVVRPNIWRENGGQASIQYLMGQLIVTAPVSVQEMIGDAPRQDAGERFGM